MRRIRIYQSVSLQCGQTVELDPQSAQHVAKVLRLAKDDALLLFNGEGGEYHGIIEQIGKRSTRVLLQTRVEHDCESPLQIILGQCISRGDRMDYAIQKSVELGVNSIYPLNSQRSGVHIAVERQQKRRLHWQRIAISACEQSGRNTVPVIQPISSLQHWIAATSTEKNFLLDPDASMTIKQLALPSEDMTTQKISLLIGPEGGLSREEINLAKQAGFIALRLGPRVLRTETAAVVTLTALQTIWGDLA